MSEICQNPTLQSPLNVASKDKFILVLTLPKILREMSKTDPDLDIDSVQISVHGTIVPDITVPAVEVDWVGQTLNFSSHHRPNHPPISVNFVVDNDYKNYYVLWRWLAVLNDPRLSIYDGTPGALMTAAASMESGMVNEYQTTFSILALNEYNETVVEFVYHNAFITNLRGINYSYRDGEILETTADFQFNQFNMIRKKKNNLNLIK